MFHYEDLTIAYKLYGNGNVPKDEQIIKDMEVILQAYAKYMLET
ncbi:DUF3578 domain-containing protein [Heliobacillus mobilis]|uniref:DUF3578 domain-containing protein n=1 Tax=Heliobacterium mobile TaxID=28064 RepID=A0A6I3SKG8_HELMO|nr:DUF3578 domain-containing protein [Heliobacterium mobile]